MAEEEPSSYGGFAPARELKKGSVMDILGKISSGETFMYTQLTCWVHYFALLYLMLISSNLIGELASDNFECYTATLHVYNVGDQITMLFVLEIGHSVV